MEIELGLVARLGRSSRSVVLVTFFLLAALVLVYREFGTYHLAEILSAAAAVTDPTWQLSLVGWLLILGAVTKSAQFPVHFWLPETMEAPTPVSALMHAGIVNAGGYLLVRLSPVVAHAPLALATLAIIGGFTAVFASVCNDDSAKC